MNEVRENVLSLEVKKDGLAQNQDGIWVLKLRVHPADMPIALMMAEMGTRYQAALVEVTDDDQIKTQPEGKKKKGKDKTATDLVKQSGALGADPWFARFLGDSKRDEIMRLSAGQVAPNDIPSCIRLLTGVSSRKEFATDPAAAARWRALYGEYIAWKANP